MIVSNVTNNQNNQVANQKSATQSNQGVTFTDQPASQATQPVSAAVQHAQSVANSQVAQESNNNQTVERAQQQYVIPQESTPNPSSNANQQTVGQIAQNQNLTLNRDSNQSVSLNSNGRRIITVNGVNNVQQANGQTTVYSYNNGQVHQFDQNLNMTSGPSAQTIKKNDSRNAIYFSDGQKYQAQAYPEEYIKLSKTQQGLELRKVPTRSTYTFNQEGRENFNFPGRASVQKVSSYQVNNDNSVTITLPDGSTQTLQNNWVETAPASTAGSNFSDDKNSNNDNQNGNGLAANTAASSSVNANNGQEIFQLTAPKGIKASVVKKSDGLYVVSDGASYKLSNTTQYDIADNILYYSKGALTNGGSMYAAPYTTADFGKEKPDSSNEVYLGNDSNYTQHGDHLDYGELYSIEDKGNGNVNINSWDAKDPSGWLNFQVQNNKVISIKPQLMAGKTDLLPLKNAKITKSSNGDVTVTGTKPDGSNYQHTFTKNLLATNSNSTNSNPSASNNVLESGAGYQVIKDGNNVVINYDGKPIRTFENVQHLTTGQNSDYPVEFNDSQNDTHYSIGKPSATNNDNTLQIELSPTEKGYVDSINKENATVPSYKENPVVYVGDDTPYDPLKVIKNKVMLLFSSNISGNEIKINNENPGGVYFIHNGKTSDGLPGASLGNRILNTKNAKVNPDGTVTYVDSKTGKTVVGFKNNWLTQAQQNSNNNPSGNNQNSSNGSNTSTQPTGNNQSQPATDQSSTGSNTQQPNTGSNPANNNSTPNGQNKVLEQGSGYQIVQKGNNINVKYNGNVIRSYDDVSNVKSDNQGVHFNAFDNDQYVTFGKPSTLDNNNQLPFNESQTEQTLLNGAKTNSNIIYLGDNNTAYSPLSGAIHYDEIIKDGNQFRYLSAGTGVRGGFINGKPQGLDNSGEAYVTIHNVKVSPNGDISYNGTTLTHNWLKPSVTNSSSQSQNSGSSAGSSNSNNATNGSNDASNGLNHNSQNSNNSSSTTNANLPSNGSSNPTSGQSGNSSNGNPVNNSNSGTTGASHGLPTSGTNQGTNNIGSQNTSGQSKTQLGSPSNSVSNGALSSESASVTKPVTGKTPGSSLNTETSTGSAPKTVNLTTSNQSVRKASLSVTGTQNSQTNDYPLNSKKGSVSASSHTVSPASQSSSLNGSPIIGSHATESDVNGQTGSSTNSKNSHDNLVVNGSIKANQGHTTTQAGKQSQNKLDSNSKDATKGSGSVAISRSSAAAQSGKGSQHQVQGQPVNVKKNPAKVVKTSSPIAQLASKRATCSSNASTNEASCGTPCANTDGQTAGTVVQQSVVPKNALATTGSSAISALNPATAPVAQQVSAPASVVGSVSKATSAPTVVQNTGSSSSSSSAMPNTGNDNEIATEFGLVGAGLILGLAAKRTKKSK